ncbi:hypothetical protein F383_07379 [Gossypium arboreum]|uniref:Uncharacterized protein n=1 Tax=Gossypium arboreum TaxID=29729 RepID=A0A0B0N6Z6_GOSAR|nr:hypothetical protein F383_07379 [Gossypium arboreum]
MYYQSSQSHLSLSSRSHPL